MRGPDHAHHVYNISKMFSKHLDEKHFDNIYIEMFSWKKFILNLEIFLEMFC